MSSRSKSVGEIVEEAKKSYIRLYDKYGVKPNAWVMSIKYIEELSRTLCCYPDFINENVIQSSPIVKAKFMGLPINPTTTSGVIKAVIQEEDD